MKGEIKKGVENTKNKNIFRAFVPNTLQTMERPGISLSFVIKESWPKFPFLWENFLNRVMGFLVVWLFFGGFFFPFCCRGMVCR